MLNHPLLLAFLAIIAPGFARASTHSLALEKADVQKQLVIDLKNPDHYVRHWLRMISETSQDENGRWIGIAKKFAVSRISAGLYVLIFQERYSVHGQPGTDESPLYFTFDADCAHDRCRLSNFTFTNLGHAGLLGRQDAFYTTSPTSPGLSAETRTEIVSELYAKILDNEPVKNFVDSGGKPTEAVNGYVVDVIQNDATVQKTSLRGICREKPGFDGIAICQYGFEAGGAREDLTFEIYDSNYVNGKLVSRYLELIPGTLAYEKN